MITSHSPLAVAATLALCLAQPLCAQHGQAHCDGASVVPGTLSTARAWVTAELRATPLGEPQMDYRIHLQGLDLDGNQTPDPLDDVTAVHLHLAPRGSNGPHALNIFGMPGQDDADLVVDAAAGTLTGVWDDGDERFIAANPPASSRALGDVLGEVMRGELYLQVHSNAVPSGEIRGQIHPDWVFPLESTQVVGGGGTASAPSFDDGDLVFDAIQGTLNGSWDGTDAQINPAAPLTRSSVDPESMLEELFADGLYVEVDTAGAGTAALRGQMRFGAPLPGTGEDLRLATGLDGGAPDTGPSSTAKDAAEGQILTVRIDSPGGRFAASPVVLFWEPRPSGSLPIGFLFPDFDLGFGLRVLFNGTVPGPLPSVLGSGLELQYLLPPDSAGTTARLQAVALAATADNGILAISEAHDIRIR